MVFPPTPFRSSIRLAAALIISIIAFQAFAPDEIRAEALTANLRAAAFRCDATPPLGQPMIWAIPLVSVETPLLAKGVVLEDGADRYVLCSVDYCLIGNETEQSLRGVLARATGTSPEHVAIHTIHQHDAPYADEGAYRLLDDAPSPKPHLSVFFMNDLQRRLAAAASGAMKKLEPFDRVGWGEAEVERVASARRLTDKDGKPVTRASTGGKTKALAEAPEGDIDRTLRVVTLAQGAKPLVRLHYYATHPQTVSCDGRATADFVGEAREAVENEEGVPQIYFTGCSGDVTVGKYNDTTLAAFDGLEARLETGMKAAIAATKYEPIARVVWRTDRLVLPLRKDPKFIAQSRAWIADPKESDYNRIYAGAIRSAFINRIARPIAVSSLELGGVHILHLPGEPVLEYQKYALSLAENGRVAVAGYGDYGPAYICTDKMFEEGGYEPSAANTGPGSEARLKAAIRALLGKE